MSDSSSSGEFSDSDSGCSENDHQVDDFLFTETSTDDAIDEATAGVSVDTKAEIPTDRAKKNKAPLYEQNCTYEDILLYLGKLNEEELLEYSTSLENDLLKKEQPLELVEGVTSCSKCKSNKI